MLLYSKLGRHTPPPPPYPESERNTPKVTSRNKISQVSAPPPPPPPYSSSTPKQHCTLPSIDELRRQAVIVDNPYLCHNGNAIPRPSVPKQRYAAQVVNSHISLEDYSGIWELDRCRLEVPAHPVEPKWTPVGALGYPGPPLGSATAPFPRLSREPSSQSMLQGCPSSARARTRPDHERRISQSPGIGCLGHSSHSCATHAPVHTRTQVQAMGQKGLHTPRKRPGKVDAWLANAGTNHTTASFETSGTICPLSALPPRQALEERRTLIQTSASQGLGVVERMSDVNSLLSLNNGGNSDRDLSDENSESNSAAMAREGQYHASPARSEYESRLCKEYTMPRGQVRGHHVQNLSAGRPLASARVAPYQRRQSKAARRIEHIEHRLKVSEDGGEIERSN